MVSFNVLATKQIEKRITQMVSANTLCKNVLNVKNTVIENFNLYSDEDGVKHIRIKARPNKWHENDCPFCHKLCPAYDKHSSRPATWRGGWPGVVFWSKLNTRRIVPSALNMGYMLPKFYGHIHVVDLPRISTLPLHGLHPIFQEVPHHTS